LAELHYDAGVVDALIETGVVVEPKAAFADERCRGRG
jgi:hypothetical protein